jgi:hypothetical protein
VMLNVRGLNHTNINAEFAKIASAFARPAGHQYTHDNKILHTHTLFLELRFQRLCLREGSCCGTGSLRSPIASI